MLTCAFVGLCGAMLTAASQVAAPSNYPPWAKFLCVLSMFPDVVGLVGIGRAAGWWL